MSITEVDLAKLTEEVKPTLEAIIEQTDGLVKFDPDGVGLWGRGDEPYGTPAIAWWVNDSDNEFFVDMTDDLRAEVAKGLRRRAAQLIEAAEAIEA